MTLLNLVVAASLTGAPTAIDDSYSNCIDSTSTNPEWAECGAAYLNRLENALNVAWKKAYGSLDGHSRAQLLQEQRAWIKFKDASCQFYANGSFGREGQVLDFYACRGAILEARISDLSSIEGDDPPR